MEDVDLTLLIVEQSQNRQFFMTVYCHTYCDILSEHRFMIRSIFNTEIFFAEEQK